MTGIHEGCSAWMILVSVLSGLVVFQSIFITSRKYLQSRSRRLGLSNVSVQRISARFVSGFQGITACIAGVIIISSCRDVINDSNWTAEAYAWFLCTYLYFDTYLGYQEYILSKDKENTPNTTWLRLREYLWSDPAMTIHHVVLPLLILPMISLVQRGAYFFGCFLFAEAVLPFKAYRDVAVELKKQQTTHYLVNAVFFILTFIVSRFLIYLYMWKGYADQIGIGVLEVPRNIPIQCNLGCLAYALLNVYFMKKIVSQARLEANEWFYRVRIKVG